MPGRQVEPERVHEPDIGDDGEHDRDADVAQIAPAAEAEGDAEEQDRRGRHEAEELEQQDLLDQADADGGQRHPVYGAAAGAGRIELAARRIHHGRRIELRRRLRAPALPGEREAEQRQDGADQDRYVLGPDLGVDRDDADRLALVENEGTEGGNAEAQDDLGRRPPFHEHGPYETRPSVFRIALTRSFSSARYFENSSPER